MEPIAGSYRIHRRTLHSACFVASRPISSVAVVIAFFPLFVSPGGSCRRLALLRFPIQSNMRCGFCCLLAVAGDNGGRFSSLVIFSSFHHFAGRCRHAFPCLLAARLAFPPPISSHLIARRLARLLPVLRHGWAGREAGSVGALCLLGFALRSVPMSIGRFMLYLPAMSPRSACLSARLRGRWRSHLIMRGVLRCPCLPPVGSSRLSPRLATR